MERSRAIGFDPDWQVAGTGDFNGDGRDDVLLRHANGWMTEWLGQSNGSFFRQWRDRE